jgi:hypothetical protein
MRTRGARSPFETKPQARTCIATMSATVSQRMEGVAHDGKYRATEIGASSHRAVYPEVTKCPSLLLLGLSVARLYRSETPSDNLWHSQNRLIWRRFTSRGFEQPGGAQAKEEPLHEALPKVTVPHTLLSGRTILRCSCKDNQCVFEGFRLASVAPDPN